MEHKIGIAIVILGLAALSPAPINESKVGSVKRRPQQTQAQLAAEQKFNGIVPIVGQVPRYVNEVGEPKSKDHSNRIEHDGDRSLLLGSIKADKVGAAAIVKATDRVVAEESGSYYGWISALFISVAGFLGWKLFQYKIEKSTPVPEFSKRLLKEIENGRA